MESDDAGQPKADPRETTLRQFFTVVAQSYSAAQQELARSSIAHNRFLEETDRSVLRAGGGDDLVGERQRRAVLPDHVRNLRRRFG